MRKHAYIGGSFDPPHKGHLRLIERVIDLGFEPIIVINSDNFIREYKGREPHMSEGVRQDSFIVAGYTTYITSKEEQKSMILKIKPSVIVVGLDWMRPSILPQLGIDENFLTKYDISMLFLPRTPNINSTQLREQNE